MLPKAHIKKGDTVVVTTGKEKGKTGKVLRVLRSEGKVVVEKVNEVKRHQRATGQAPGGIVTKEAPLAISNVMIADPKSGKATRIGRKIVEGKNGKPRRVRYAKASGELLDK